MYGIPMLSEAQTIALMGPERFQRVRAEKYLTPCMREPGHEGERMYARHDVEFRLQEDRELHPAPAQSVGRQLPVTVVKRFERFERRFSQVFGGK